MDLTDIRSHIDEIDNKLVELFCERMRLVKQVSVAKALQGLAIADNKREDEISGRIIMLADEEFSPYVLQLFQLLFSLAKEYQAQIADTAFSINTGL
jgi:chorismate mutase/prephenate dehydratase